MEWFQTKVSIRIVEDASKLVREHLSVLSEAVLQALQRQLNEIEVLLASFWAQPGGRECALRARPAYQNRQLSALPAQLQTCAPACFRHPLSTHCQDLQQQQHHASATAQRVCLLAARALKHPSFVAVRAAARHMYSLARPTQKRGQCNDLDDF